MSEPASKNNRFFEWFFDRFFDHFGTHFGLFFCIPGLSFCVPGPQKSYLSPRMGHLRPSLAILYPFLVHFDRFGIKIWSFGTHLGGIFGNLRHQFRYIFAAQDGKNKKRTPKHKHPNKHGGGHCAAAQLDPRGALGAPQARARSRVKYLSFHYTY